MCEPLDSDWASDNYDSILQLLYLGREYPGGPEYFRNKLKTAFLKNRNLKSSEEIESALARGNFVTKELEGTITRISYSMQVLFSSNPFLCFYSNVHAKEI